MIALYIIISLLVIGTLIGLLYRCENKTQQGFCTCTGLDTQDCTPRLQRKLNYTNGLTENSKRPHRYWDKTKRFKFPNNRPWK